MSAIERARTARVSSAAIVVAVLLALPGEVCAQARVVNEEWRQWHDAGGLCGCSVTLLGRSTGVRRAHGLSLRVAPDYALTPGRRRMLGVLSQQLARPVTAAT